MRICALLTIVWVNALCAQSQPLRNLSSRRAAGEISILSVNFQELKFGHEGPSYFSAKRAPYRGKQEIAEVSLFGQESIGSVRFELIGETGRVVGTVAAFRVGDGADADEYMLRIDVPQLPFRFRICGADLGGQPFQSTFRRLFVPIEGSVRKDELPPGLSAREVGIFTKLIDDYEKETRVRFDAAQGEIRIARSGVSDAAYQPLTSATGNAIGLRVAFTARFGAAGFYTVTPRAFPVYDNPQWRGQIDMKVLDAGVTPVPPNSPELLADGVHSALQYGGAAHYDAGVDYRFTFDLVPNYIIRSADGARYCAYLETYRAANRLALWEAIMASTQAVKYRIDISNLDFASETAPLPPQRTWFESFRREGAADCGPNPRIN
jgi:hypothetical protein